MPKYINPYGYLMAKGEGNKGASYKASWRPDWRLPPGVNQGKVFLQVLALCGLAALPVYGIPSLSANKDEAGKKPHEDLYTRIKMKNREERMKWIQADDMPYK